MEKLIVAIFDSERQAGEGRTVLKQLHDEGALTVYAAARIVKAADGTASYEELTNEGPRPLLLGGLIGAVLGLLGGPLGIAAGVAGGAFMATMYDFVRAGGREELLNEVTEHLLPGRAAVVAHVDETQVHPVDAALRAVGGAVFRQPVAESEYVLLEQDLASLHDEIHELEAEHAEATGEARTQLEAALETLRSRRQARAERARTLLQDSQQVADFKIASLDAQAALANGSRKSRLHAQAARVRAEQERRRARLQQACEAPRGSGT